MRRYIAAFAACVVLAAMFAGCHSQEDQPVETGNSAQTEATTQTEVTEAMEATEATDATEAPVQAESKGIVINTKFGNLYYQDQWEDFMQIEQSEGDTYVIVAFEADIDGIRYPLFHLTIGEGEGEPIGQITDAQGVKRDVFVHMEEIGIISELTEGEQNRLFAMQEEINYVIENLE